MLPVTSVRGTQMGFTTSSARERSTAGDAAKTSPRRAAIKETHRLGVIEDEGGDAIAMKTAAQQGAAWGTGFALTKAQKSAESAVRSAFVSVVARLVSEEKRAERSGCAPMPRVLEGVGADLKAQTWMKWSRKRT